MKIRLNRKRTSGKRTSIIFVIRSKGSKQVIASGVSVETADWDVKRERCRTDVEANTRLSEARKRIEQHIERYGHPPNTLEIAEKERKQILSTILDHGRRVVARNGAPNTGRTYTTLVNNLTRYCKKYDRKELYVDEISEDYMQGFLEWLIEENYSSNHSGKMMRTLRTVVRRIIPAEKWDTVRPPVSKSGEMVYLTVEEIRKIEALDLQDNEKLLLTREQFLAGYYTGQRFSDWNQIAGSRVLWNGGVRTLSIYQAKTQNKVTIPVQPKLTGHFR